MGTSFTIKASQLPEGVRTRRLETLIKRRLAEINQQMSTYIVDSELSVINSSKNTGAQFISPELFKLLFAAQEISVATGGAYDVTVGPLVNLWGFGPDKTLNQTPTDEQIQQALANTGYNKLELTTRLMTLTKPQREIYIDLSSLAKGFAVDEVANVLEKQGVAV
jgi:thiamine biosynthesis lipoprotein